MDTAIQPLDITAQDKKKSGRTLSLLQWMGYILAMAVDVIGIGLTLIGLAWIVVGDRNLFTWHFGYLMPGIIALSPIFMLSGFLVRRRWIIFHATPAILFIFFYGIFFIPRSPAVPADTPQLRVMTYNTKYGTTNAPKMAQLILEADADVIALQELSESAAEYFAEHLTTVYPYQITHTNGTSVTGKGLLSRYPLENERYETPNGWLFYLRAQIDFEGAIVTIVNTHPAPPEQGLRFNTRNRSQHIDWIMDILATESGAIVLLGDFNTTEHSADYRQITAQFHDSVREVGIGLGQTFPDSSAWGALGYIPPLIRIDYVFHSDHLQAVSAGAWHTSAGSDHRPVVANLILNPSFK